MELYSILASMTTIVSFVVFIGIVLWAWSSRRKEAFDEAAQAPFALDDDDARAGNNKGAARS